MAAPDKEAIVLTMVNRELNEIMYERPAKWVRVLGGPCKTRLPSRCHIDTIAEAKATRDLLVHNRGIVTKLYGVKAGKLARGKEGQGIGVSEHYHRSTWKTIRKIIVDVSQAAAGKVR